MIARDVCPQMHKRSEMTEQLNVYHVKIIKNITSAINSIK